MAAQPEPNKLQCITDIHHCSTYPQQSTSTLSSSYIAMPSIKANLLWYVIWLKFRSTKQQTEQGLLEHIRDTWQSSDPAVPPPASFAADDSIEITRERMKGGQQWEVFHCRPRGGSDKVTLYWHGGAFIRRVSSAAV